MILAAGYGMRMRPLTEEIPKPLLKLFGIPLIFFSLSLLKKAGIKNIVINLHYKGDKIQQTLNDGKQFGLNIQYTFEDKILGTGGGVKNAENLLLIDNPVEEEDFVLINSDLICDVDIKQVYKFHRSRKGFATMVLFPMIPDKNYPGVQIDKSYKVQKVRDNQEYNGLKTYMFTGIHILNNRVLNYLPAGESDIIETLYKPALNRYSKLFGFIHKGLFLDIGDRQQYEKLHSDEALKPRLEKMIEGLFEE